MSAATATLTLPQTTAVDRRPLHIAMVAPPYFEIPPAAYGGVEAIVADLVDALADRGHHVTLISAGNHATKASRFVATRPDPVPESLGEAEPEVLHAARVAEALDRLDVDIVHDHTLAGPLLARGRLVPTLVTVHGPVAGAARSYYEALGDTVGLVGISNAQRAAAPKLPWVATVYNSVRSHTFPFRADKEPYVLFLGRFHPHKAPHLAIDAARAAGRPIVLAGKCSEPIEREYYTLEVEPRLGPDTTVFGVADAAVKRDLLARASCLIFPVRWEEPFGLVMIEAMACGTPVVALRRGSVPEVVVPGVTGVVVDDPDELPDAICASRHLAPADCREHVERNFDTAAMADGYEAAYRRMLSAIVEPAIALPKAGTLPRPAEAIGEIELSDSPRDDGDALRPTG